MPQILDTEDFIVTAYDEPHHSRENGGHVVITPKLHFVHRTELPLDLAAKLMHLTMIVGEATTTVMKAKGLDVVRINYQDNGNWAYKQPQKEPQLHIHLYIRTTDEKHPDNDPRFQAFPDALVFPDRATGYYNSFVSLTDQDCLDIRDEINKLLSTPKYSELKF